MQKNKSSTRKCRAVNFERKHPLTKECVVILERMSDEKIKYFLNPECITHKLDMKIHRNAIQIADTTISPVDECTFNIEIKISEIGISVVKERLAPSKSNECITNKTFATNRKTAIANLNLNSIPAAWQACKRDHVKNKYVINLNDICMAKIRGHQPWPSVVLELMDKKKMCKVEFFGSESYEKFGLVSLNDVTLFKNSAVVARLVLKRNIKKYRKAIQEAELLCCIPPHASILNEYS